MTRDQRAVQGEAVDGIRVQREAVRPLLAPTDPADAMTAYYALAHDERRTRLTLHHLPSGGVDGFAAVCQTGRDLFVPLVVFRGSASVVADLISQALQQGRPYSVITLPNLEDAVTAQMTVEWRRSNRILSLDSSAFRPVVNVMVQPGAGLHRFEVRVQGEVVSAAGANWESERLADVYVYTHPDYQGRGWGRAVCAQCVQSLLRAGKLPLYTVSTEDTPSRRLAESLGFRDSGAAEFECLGRLRV